MSRVDFLGGKVMLHGGDCLDVLDTLEANSVDSVVCDPPYHLTSIVKRFGSAKSENEKFAEANPTKAYASLSRGFMGKAWDGGDIAFRAELWAKVLRVLKPGGHLVAFSGTRTYHRMVVAIEDGGFEVRDQLAWCYGSGFPKSHNLKGEWGGWGTALKPAWEPICLARKALIGTVAANVEAHGTGALNIDACRVQGGGPSSPRGSSKLDTDGNAGWTRPWMEDRDEVARREAAAMDRLEKLGRWPANLIHDGSDEVLAGFPDSVSTGGAGEPSQNFTSHNGIYGTFAPKARANAGGLGDSGSAARFFYLAKADADDRLASKHPTVKPVDLMRWLARLVTPPGGVVLDMFAGTGTTGQAAFLEGFSAILIEREEEYQADIARRMALVMAGPVEKQHALTKAKGEVTDAGPLFGGLVA